MNRMLDVFPGCKFERQYKRRDHPIARRSEGGYWVLVKGVKKIPYQGVVHNLSVAESESYVANGMAVHNCMANLIFKGASHQSNKRQEMTESRAMGTGVSSSLAASLMPKVPTVFNIYDQYGRTIQQVDSIAKGNAVIAECEKRYRLKLVDIWRILPVTVMKANTIWSDAYDSPGSAQAQLMEGGVDPKYQTPDVVSLMRDMLNHRHYAGAIVDGDE